MKIKLLVAVIAIFVAYTSYAQKKCVVNFEIENYDKGEFLFGQKMTPNEQGYLNVILEETSGRFVNLFYITKNQGILSSRIYVYPGAKIDVAFDASNAKETLTVKGGDKQMNAYLATLNELVTNDLDMLSKYDTETFLNYYDRANKGMLDNLKKLKKYGDLYTKESIDFEIYSDNLVLFYYGIAKKRNKDLDGRLEKMYSEVVAKNYDDSKYLAGNQFSDFIGEIIDIKFKYDGADDYFTSRYNFIEKYFTNKEILKRVLYSEIMGSFDTVDPDLLRDKIENYGTKYGTEKSFEQKLNSRKRYTKGEFIPQLTYSDLDGNAVTLEKYKGKNIVLYFWATWCGPCKREAPYWEELIKKYVDDNVVFITVSIDNKLETLVDYLEKVKKGGVHLHCDCTSDTYLIQTTFGIGGVPYFSIVDTEGKFVRVAAPRPSQKALQTILDNLLRK